MKDFVCIRSPIARFETKRLIVGFSFYDYLKCTLIHTQDLEHYKESYFGTRFNGTVQSVRRAPKFIR